MKHILTISRESLKSEAFTKLEKQIVKPSKKSNKDITNEMLFKLLLKKRKSKWQ